MRHQDAAWCHDRAVCDRVLPTDSRGTDRRLSIDQLPAAADSPVYTATDGRIHRGGPKISDSPASNSPHSVSGSWISTKYRTLHYLNITYGHTHYDVHTLPCVLNATSL